MSKLQKSGDKKHQMSEQQRQYEQRSDNEEPRQQIISQDGKDKQDLKKVQIPKKQSPHIPQVQKHQLNPSEVEVDQQIPYQEQEGQQNPVISFSKMKDQSERQYQERNEQIGAKTIEISLIQPLYLSASNSHQKNDFIQLPHLNPHQPTHPEKYQHQLLENNRSYEYTAAYHLDKFSQQISNSDEQHKQKKQYNQQRKDIPRLDKGRWNNKTVESIQINSQEIKPLTQQKNQDYEQGVQAKDKEIEKLRLEIQALKNQRILIQEDWTKKFYQVSEYSKQLQQKETKQNKQIESITSEKQKLALSLNSLRQLLAKNYVSYAELISTVPNGLRQVTKPEESIPALKKAIQLSHSDEERAEVFTKYLETTLAAIFSQINKIQSENSKALQEQEIQRQRLEVQIDGKDKTIEQLQIVKEKHIKVCKDLEDKLANKQTQLSKTTHQFQKLKQELDETNRRWQQTKQALDSKHQQLTSSSTQLKQKNELVNDRSGKLLQTQNKLKSKQEQLQYLAKVFESTKIQLKESYQSLDEANTKLQERVKEIEYLRSEYSALGTQLKSSIENYSSKQAEQSNKIASQQIEISKLLSQKTKFENYFKDAKYGENAAKKELVQKTKQIQSFELRLKEYASQSQKTLQRQCEMKKNYEKLQIQMQKELKAKMTKQLQAQDSEMNNKHYIQIVTKDQEIKKLNASIKQLTEAQKQLSQVIAKQKNDLQFNKVNYQAKKAEYEQEKIQVQSKTSEAITQLLSHSESSLKQQQQLIGNQYQKTQKMLVNQKAKMGLLTNALSQLVEQLSTAEETLVTKDLHISKIQGELQQTQTKVQQQQQQISALKQYIQQRQQQTDEELQATVKAFNAKMQQLIDQSSEFYCALIQSKEENFQNRLSSLQCQLDLHSTINQYKDKAHSEQTAKHQKIIAALKSKLKQRQAQYKNSLRNKESVITQAKNSNEILQKKLQIAQECIEAKKEHLSTMEGERNRLMETIYRVHSALQNKNLKEILNQLDGKEEGSLNPEVLDLLNCIYYKSDETLIELLKCNHLIRALQFQNSELKKGIQHIQTSSLQSLNNVQQLKVLQQQLKQKLTAALKENASLQDKYQRLLLQNKFLAESMKGKQQSHTAIQRQLGKLRSLSEKDQKYIRKLQQKIKQTITQRDNLIQEGQKIKQESERNLSDREQHVVNLVTQISKLQEKVSALQKQLQAKQQQAKVIRPSVMSRASEAQLQSFKVEVSTLKAKIRELQSNEQRLKDKIKQLQSKQQSPKIKRQSQMKNEQNDESLLQGYQNMIQTLKEENQLLQEELAAMKAKIKRYEAERSIKSYISPPKPTQRVVSPKKSQIIRQQMAQNQSKERSPLFRSICTLQNNEQGRSFLVSKVEELYGSSKKVAETQVLYKFSEFNKTFSFLNLLPKNELLSECHVFLFGTKTNKFGAVSFKKDAVSKQSALIFSITNKKIVSKKSSADALHSFGVGVDTYGALTIGGTHWLMKASTRNLIVKDSLNKYFEPYDKKEVFGPQFWREDLNIELTQFQIHRVLLK